jgi:hypothetical protein
MMMACRAVTCLSGVYGSPLVELCSAVAIEAGVQSQDMICTRSNHWIGWMFLTHDAMSECSCYDAYKSDRTVESVV